MIGVFPENPLHASLDKLNVIIEANKRRLDVLLKQSDKTYANFVREFMDMDNTVSSFFTPIAHLQSVKNNEQSQEAFTSCIGALTAYSTELGQNIDIYNAIKYIKDSEYQRLDIAKCKVLDDMLQDFYLEGVNLPPDKKNRIKEINIRLSELENDFSQNLLDATNAYKITIADESLLGEMPKSDKDTAKSDDGWTFTLQMPSYLAFMTYVLDREKREEVYKAYCTRALENGKLITEILALRDEKSHILDCESFAEMNLKNMSAPSVEVVIEFLEKLAKAGKPYAKRELHQMVDLAKKDGVSDFSAYDTAFYSIKLKKQMFDFDEEELRPYFEKESVLKCMFDILHTMFGITFKEKAAKLWDVKAKFYELYRANELIGGLYMDLETRKDKRGGAWMNEWHTYHYDVANNIHLPEAFVVCNFPVSKDNNPSLLRHDDVTTLFHEMGHALHHLMSTVTEYSVSGTHGIDWDTIEFPSQFLENFAYAPQVLASLARHYKTNEPMPEELRNKLVATKNYQEGLALVRQIEFGLFDIRIHSKKMNDTDVQKTLDAVRNDVAVIIPPKYNKFQYGFSHIFSGGYAAGYYSYKWAEMLSSDAYCAFEKRGILDSELAKRYVATVLSMGASRKMDVIYREFLGRDPDPEAILRIAGLL